MQVRGQNVFYVGAGVVKDFASADGPVALVCVGSLVGMIPSALLI